MTLFEEKVEKVLIINKEGNATSLPSLSMAKSYATGIWKGKVDRIEVKTTYSVVEEE